MDNEYVEELIAWEHPHLATDTVASFSESENLTMLRLPQKECEPPSSSFRLLPSPYLILVTHVLFGRFGNSRSNTFPLPNARHPPLLVRLRRPNNTARSYPRKRLDNLRPYAFLFRA